MSREYTSCIAIYYPYSLFISKDKWKKVQEDKRKKRLELLRSEAETARLCLKLTKLDKTKYTYADRDLAILDF